MFLFPAGDIDEPERLLTMVGSFWASTYQGAFPVRGLLEARARLDSQLHADLLELTAAMSYRDVPVFHVQEWSFLRLRESDQKQRQELAVFDGNYLFAPDGSGGGLSWGVPVTAALLAWPLPDTLADVRVIQNRLTTPSLLWTRGIDFDLDLAKRQLLLRVDPFRSDDFAVRTLVDDDGHVVDREIGLWLYRGSFDQDHIHQQFGHVLGVPPPSSEGQRRLVNALFNGLVDGGTGLSTDRLFAAAAGVPLAERAGEVVQYLLRDDRWLWIITDQAAYRFQRQAVPTVTPGAALRVGQSLTTTLQIVEFNRGLVPADLRALAVGPGFLAAGFRDEITFENKQVPLVVEEDVAGYTRVSFEVGGEAGDVGKLWDDVHAGGVAAGQTLAMLLDRRPAGARDTQPTAAALPAVINPLGFLAANVFRDNLYVVRLRPAGFGPEALGLHAVAFLRKIIQPGTAVIVLVELLAADAPVILDAPGDDTRPGVTEALTSFAATAHTEAIDPTAFTAERVRGRQLGEDCQAGVGA